MGKGMSKRRQIMGRTLEPGGKAYWIGLVSGMALLFDELASWNCLSFRE